MQAALYTRPKGKAATLPPRKKQVFNKPVLPSNVDVIEVDTFTECHVTPTKESRLMASYCSSINPDTRILEPQGGTGNLIAALIEKGVLSKQITTVERHYKLCEQLEHRFNGAVTVVQDCFIDFANSFSGKYDLILSNPPFKNVKSHINSALSLLAEGGEFIALVPISFSHPEAVDLEDLDPDIFPTVKVNTKLIAFYK